MDIPSIIVRWHIKVNSFSLSFVVGPREVEERKNLGPFLCLNPYYGPLMIFLTNWSLEMVHGPK